MRNIIALSSMDVYDYERGNLNLLDMKLPDGELFVPTIYISDPAPTSLPDAMAMGWDFTIKSEDGVVVQFDNVPLETKKKWYNIANDIAKKHNERNEKCVLYIRVQFLIGLESTRGKADEVMKRFEKMDAEEVAKVCADYDSDPSVILDSIETH